MYDAEDFYEMDAFADDFNAYGAYADETSVDPWEYGFNTEYSDFDWRSSDDDAANAYYTDEYYEYYDLYGAYASGYGNMEYSDEERAHSQGDCVQSGDGSVDITSAGAYTIPKNRS